MSKVQDLYSTLVVNCVLNAFLTYSAIAMNIITAQALRKTSLLPKPLKTLLLSLTVSDLGVRLLDQPVYIAVLVMNIERNIKKRSYNTINTAHHILGNLFCTVSFFGVTLTVDRFLAIHLHLRHQEIVTPKRVVAAVISAWVVSALVSLFELFAEEVLDIIYTAFATVSLITIGLFLSKIYTTVRSHAKQIHVLQVQQVAQNGEMANTARLRKTALVICFVYVGLLVCYLPFFCVKVSISICGKTAFLYHLLYCTWTLVVFNSSLYPLIYPWNTTPIRKALTDMLRNIFASTSYC